MVKIVLLGLVLKSRRKKGERGGSAIQEGRKEGERRLSSIPSSLRRSPARSTHRLDACEESHCC